MTETERAPIPEIRQYPRPQDQALVDAILRDPLTTAAEHLQRLNDGKYASLSSAATQAWKRLRRPEVQEYMRVQQERIRQAADLESHDLLQMLTMIMRTDITQIVAWDEHGNVTYKDPSQLPTHARRSIKKIKSKTRQFESQNGDITTETTTELELYSALDAMKLFSEIAGLKGTDGSTNIDNRGGVIYLNPPQSENEALDGKHVYEG